MQISYRQFPHPVLSYFSDDVIGVEFQTSIKTQRTQNTYIFEVTSYTSCDDLVRLVKERKARYAFHFECQSTRFRRMFASFDEKFSFEIHADELDGKVQICAFILAAEDIDQYCLPEFHQDYEGHVFSVKKGDVLAIDNERSFYAEKITDPLKRIPSIFSVVPDHSEGAPSLDFDCSDDKIVVKMNAENFEKYKYLSVSQSLQPLLSSLIVLPVLVSVLEMMKSVDSLEYEESRWYQVIRNRLKAIGKDIHNQNDSLLVMAQQLIGDPITTSLLALENTVEEE